MVGQGVRNGPRSHRPEERKNEEIAPTRTAVRVARRKGAEGSAEGTPGRKRSEFPRASRREINAELPAPARARDDTALAGRGQGEEHEGQRCDADRERQGCPFRAIVRSRGPPSRTVAPSA